MEAGTDQSVASSATNGQLIARLLRLSWRYRGGCIKVIVLQLGLVVLQLSGLSLTGVGIDYVRYQLEPAAAPAGWSIPLGLPGGMSPMAVLAVLALTIFLLALCRGGLDYTYNVQVAKLVQQRIVVRLRTEVYDKLQRLSFRFFDRNASGSIINRVTRDVQATRMFIDGVLMQTIVLLLSLIVYTTYMFSIHVWLSVVCLATTPILWVLTATFSRRVRPAYMENRELFDDLVRVLSESVQGVRVIKSFAQESQAEARFEAANRRVMEQKNWIFRQVTTFGPVIRILTQLNLIVLLGYGGYLVLRGELALGSGLVVFAGLLQQFSNQVANVTGIANSVQESLTGARRVFEILDAPVEVRSPANPVPLPSPRGEVRFEGVGFQYTPGEPALRDIDLTVEAGQCVAILGATGSGKSTLLSLVSRFYDPTEGRILLDGIDLRELDLDELRRHIGMVFQENFLFSNTVTANIAFGHPEASMEQIQRAARITAADEFVRGLADGYETILGEDGVDLSGGQRQRLALARAILLEPAILILDDPTAAIDPETEGEILDAMEAAMRGRTTFVVAHRLSTLRRADRIVVLERGRIAEIGTHDQLMRNPGHYRDAAALQLADAESLGELEALR